MNTEGITVGLSPWLQATLTEGFGDPNFKISFRFRRKGTVGKASLGSVGPGVPSLPGTWPSGVGL